MFEPSLTYKVALRLWESFAEVIKSGNQIYFCFNRELLRSTLSDLFTGDCVAEFFKLASSLYFVSGKTCELDESVFSKDSHGVSQCIIIVAQQILVVEDMVNEGGISEDAYFPRLRRRISPELGEASLNPLSTAEFIFLWDQFRLEAVEKGAKDISLTFFSGLGSNRCRSFPMSQALLSTQDLSTLISKLPKESSVTKTSNEMLYDLIKKNKFTLSSRGRRVLTVGWLHDRIISQVRSFIGSERAIMARVEKQFSLLRNSELRIYSQGDYFEESYQLRAFLPSSEQVEGINDVIKICDSRLNYKSGIFLKLHSENKEYWSTIGDDSLFQIGDVLLIVTKKGEFEKVANLMKAYWDNSKACFGEISVSEHYHCYTFKVPSIPKRECLAKDGFIFEKIERSIVRLNGGLCLNSRSNTYLLGFPPDSILLEGKSLSTDQDILVNGMQLKFGDFLKSTRSLKKDHTFRVNVGEISFTLIFVQYRNNSLSKRALGFLYEQSQFGCVSEEIYEESNSLVGYSYTGVRLETSLLKRKNIIQLILNDSKNWIGISIAEKERVNFALETSGFPLGIVKTAMELVERYSACPKELIAAINE